MFVGAMLHDCVSMPKYQITKNTKFAKKIDQTVTSSAPTVFLIGDESFPAMGAHQGWPKWVQ